MKDKQIPNICGMNVRFSFCWRWWGWWWCRSRWCWMGEANRIPVEGKVVRQYFNLFFVHTVWRNIWSTNNSAKLNWWGSSNHEIFIIAMPALWCAWIDTTDPYNIPSDEFYLMSALDWMAGLPLWLARLIYVSLPSIASIYYELRFRSSIKSPPFTYTHIRISFHHPPTDLLHDKRVIRVGFCAQSSESMKIKLYSVIMIWVWNFSFTWHTYIQFHDKFNSV